MESILESLEELNVSEECYGDILNLVEAIINEKWAETHTMGDVRKAARNSVNKRYEEFKKAEKEHGIDATNQHLIGKIPEVKRAHDRYMHAHFNSLGSDSAAKAAERMKHADPDSSDIDIETNKVYPDNMKVSKALKKRPKSNIVKYNITPNIKNLGKSKV